MATWPKIAETREERKKKKTMNRFEALVSRVMQCGVKEVRR